MKSLRLPWTSLLLLVALLCLTPYAMRFAPAEESGPHASDPLHPQRVAFIAFGLLATVASFAEMMILLVRHRTTGKAWIPASAVWLACYVIGWRCFPYWVLGVYQVSLGAYPWRDQDPKRLMPMTWIDDLWRMPIFLFEVVAYTFVIGLLVTAVMAVWERRIASATVIVAGALISGAFLLLFSSDYLNWLMD